MIGTAREENHNYLRRLGATPVTYGPGLTERIRALAPPRGEPGAVRLAEPAALYARADLAFHVRRTYPLDRAADAHRDLETGHGRGKVVITIG